MGIGITSNNLVVDQGSSWEDLFGIDVDTLTNITRANFQVMVLGTDLKTIAFCIYSGTADITLSELGNLPQDSVIIATRQAAGTPATAYIAVKTAAKGTATFKFQAIAT